MIIDPGKSLECSSVFIETYSNLSCHILYYVCCICYLFDFKSHDFHDGVRPPIERVFLSVDTFVNRSHAVKYDLNHTCKLLKKLARIEAIFFCRQWFANVFGGFLCAVHTCQLEVAKKCQL